MLPLPWKKFLAMNMYDLVIRIHSVISSLFFLAALLILTLSIRGWVRNLAITPLFRRSTIAYLFILYLQFITGISMYLFLQPDRASGLNHEAAVEQFSLRFWAIEHVSLMLFALIFAQTGYLLIRQMTDVRKIFRASAIYYGTAFLVVLFSLALILIK